MSDTSSDTPRSSVGDATRERLIQSAERLVAERGVDSVSVRDITNDAGANSASIHYHFRSKEGLLRAVLEYRADMMRERRTGYLEQIAGGEPTIEEIVHAVVSPTFDLAASGQEHEAAAYVAFIAALLDHGALVPVVREYFDAQFSAYVDVARGACPHLSDEMLLNRLTFGFFLVFNTASEPPRGLRTWIGLYDADALGRVKEDLIQFIVGGLRAGEG